MPLNINSVGSSGIGGSHGGNGTTIHEKYTDRMVSDIGGITFSNFNTDEKLIQSNMGSENVQYPKYPCLFFEYKNDIYAYGMPDSNMQDLYKVTTLTWAAGTSTGGITYTKIASVGKSSILTASTIRDKVFIVGSSSYDSENKTARLYMFDGTTITDVFGKDMLNLSDVSGNTPSSDSYVYSRATSRRYYICPVAKSDDQLVDEMIIVGTYYDGTSSSNHTYVYWYQISVVPNIQIKKIVKVGSTSSSLPGAQGIFTSSGKYFSSTWYNNGAMYDTKYFTYLNTLNYVINENTVTLTSVKQEIMGGDYVVQWSNLSYPLNNNYAVAVFDYRGRRDTNEIYIVNAKNDDISYSKISTNVPQLNSNCIGNVWTGTYAFITYRYKTPCILVSYNASPGSSDYYYINVYGGKISSEYTVSSNNGNYSISGYFEKGDTVYSDDGLFKYEYNGSTTSFNLDKYEFVIPNSGVYTIYSRCSTLHPLEVPPLILKTNTGNLMHLQITDIDQTTIQANTTSNITINGTQAKYGINQYTSDNGRFKFELK